MFPLGAMIMEAFLEVVGLSWAHREKEEGSPGAELRICMRLHSLQDQIFLFFLVVFLKND